MRAKNAILAVLIATVGVALYFGGGKSAPQTPEVQPPQTAPSPAASSAAPQARVPPYYPSAEEARPLPRTLPPEQFSIFVVAQAYHIAQRIPGVLAQQPCYCWCDKYGHGSLLDCFASEHGAG